MAPSPHGASAPEASRRPSTLIAHGDERIDDWYWLRDRGDPEVTRYLEAENAFTAAVASHTSELRERVYGEILSRIQQTDVSVPVRKGPWIYYTRTEEAKHYPIHCRRPAQSTDQASGSPDAPMNGFEAAQGAGARRPAQPDVGDARPAQPDVGDARPAQPDVGGVPEPGEQVLLDQNELASGTGYLALGAFAVSPDHRLLAYSTDTSGAERYTLRIRDIESGNDLEDVIENTYYGTVWANDSATLFYTRPNAAMRPYQLWRHTIGGGEDTCVHQEDDEHFYLAVGKTKDERIVLLELESKQTTEVWWMDAEEPESPFSLIQPRSEGVEYSVSHHEDRFLIVTNADADNFRLVSAPESAPGRPNWADVVPHREDVRLEGIDVFRDHIVLYERCDAITRIRVMDLRTGQVRTVEQPESVSTAWGGPNPEFESGSLRYEYTSMVTPHSVFEYDLGTGSIRLLKRQPVLGGYDPAAYETERLWATAPDGVQVPMSIVRRRGVPLDPDTPALLYGYGAYEHSVDPSFSAARLSLIDRGFIFAIAHVRGGGEMGRHWYDDGKLLRKKNTFSDFLACARHLLDEGWTSPERLVARGGSAGGLLMGAVANTAPELFCAIVAEVPFVDCLTTMLDDSLPLTAFEWEEWGNPAQDIDVYRYLKSYSPYDNVGTRPYPPLLVTAALNDPRVGYWEPAKWVAKLRAMNPAIKVLLKTEMGTGHQGPSGRYEAWREEAFVLAFILDSVGISG